MGLPSNLDFRELHNMANAGQISSASNLTNIKTLPDLVKYISAFTIDVTTQFNHLISNKLVWGAVGQSGNIISGSPNFGVTILATGIYSIFFRQAFTKRPAITINSEFFPGISFIGLSQVMFQGQSIGFSSALFYSRVIGTTYFLNSPFSFIAYGGK